VPIRKDTQYHVNVSVNDVMQTEISTARPLMPEHTFVASKTAIGKSGRMNQ
jgi:hypothetical protein